LVVTHDPRILPFADRVVHMEDGALTVGQAATANPRGIIINSRADHPEGLVHS
jgi:ABC-type lipoprotein export system ATPase subunit